MCLCFVASSCHTMCLCFMFFSAGNNDYSCIQGQRLFANQRCIMLCSILIFSPFLFSYGGAPGWVVGWGTALPAGRSWVRFPMALLCRLTRNEYHEYLMRGKGGRCVGLPTTFFYQLCRNCVSLKLLEP
jgi:hypothetical protein